MKKNLLSVLLIVTVLVASLAIFAACNPDDNGGAEVKPYAIPEDLAINIEIYESFDDSDSLLGTITNSSLEGVTQEKITMSTTNSENTPTSRTYIAYKLSDIVTKCNITLPATISRVQAFDTSYTKKYLNEALTTLNNSYISIGIEVDGAFDADKDDKGANAPRFISDKNSTSSNSVWKSVDKIVINPLDKTKPVLNVSMLQGTKTNDISVPFASYAETVENVSYEYTEDEVTKTFYGFNLVDILNSMGKIKSDETWMGFISNYTSVGFVCSGDEATDDYSTRVFTKAEIESDTNYIKIVKDGDITRCYSDLTDIMYRSRLKNITKIVVYGEDAATLTISWSYAAAE